MRRMNCFELKKEKKKKNGSEYEKSHNTTVVRIN